jgi:hypothetical protein
MTGPRIRIGPPRAPQKHGGGRPMIDLAGQQFGRLLVIERVQQPATVNPEQRGIWWRCLCSCGRAAVFSSARLRGGKLQHCGNASHRRA